MALVHVLKRFRFQRSADTEVNSVQICIHNILPQVLE